MKPLLAIPAMVLATTTTAAPCPDRLPAKPPDVPDGQQATFEQMYAAQLAVNAYVDTIEAYLDCRAEMLPIFYNQAVDRAELAAAAYNEQLSAFRKRQSLIATN